MALEDVRQHKASQIKLKNQYCDLVTQYKSNSSNVLFHFHNIYFSDMKTYCTYCTVEKYNYTFSSLIIDTCSHEIKNI